MKTKTKTFALLGIAIVLCSILLVSTLPSVAADQTDEPLEIYGNANEDDTIDMRDTTYIKLVIFGKKPKTDLADANNDGKVSMLDVGQTKLIILGKEGKLTFVDIFGEAVTVNKPIKRLVQLGSTGLEVTRYLGAGNKIVAINRYNILRKIFYAEFIKLPALGYNPDDCDFEMILSLNPDAVMTNLEYESAVVRGGLEKKRIFEEKLPGIPLISLNMREQEYISKSVATYGYILDKEDEAEEFIDWWEGYLNAFEARTEGLSEDERPNVYLETTKPWRPPGSGNRVAKVFILAGGRNILDEIVGHDDSQYGHYTFIDPEWVIEQNPDIIIRVSSGSVKLSLHGYETDDLSGMRAARQEIFNRPVLANVKAVKNEAVYVLDYSIFGGGGNTIIGTAYLAKLFHPELFTDVDPQAIHQEYVTRFCRIDFNVKEHGAFVYPPCEEW